MIVVLVSLTVLLFGIDLILNDDIQEFHIFSVFPWQRLCAAGNHDVYPATIVIFITKPHFCININI